MAVAPTERWPSMDALLAELARDPARTRRRFALAATAVLAAGGLVAFALTRGGEPEPCQGSADVIASAWGGPGRRAAIAHLASLTSAYARESTPRLTAELDAYAGRWAELHRGACQAHQHGEISSQLLDRRAACLAIRKAALATVRELAETSSAAAIPQLVVATSGLPELGTCEDDSVLLSLVAPPNAMQAPVVADVANLLARVDVERDAGRADPATRDADQAVARAQTLAYRPLLARALLARGRVDQSLWRGDRGAAAFTVASRLALAAGDDPLAVEAYARAAWAIGTTDDPAKATDGLALIEALTERTGARAPFARALLDNNLGGLALTRGDRAAARVAFERARAGATHLSGAEAIELTSVLLNLLLVVEDPTALERIGRELVDVRSRLLGTHHPSTMIAQIIAAEAIDDATRMRATLEPACAELDRRHPDQRRVIEECSYELAWLAILDGDADTARAMIKRMLSTTPPAEASLRQRLLAALLPLLDGDPAAASKALDELRTPAATDAPWWDVLDAVDVATASALAHHTAGEGARSSAELELASALLERINTAMPVATFHRHQRAIATVRARIR
jgi:eukaryotic-like serine/threonine-protein kinase